MDGYDESNDNPSTYNTPYHDVHHPADADLNSWTFPEQDGGFSSPSHRPIDRPRLSRHSSLPRALFTSGSTSIFGSGAVSSSPRMHQQQQRDTPPPTLSIREPSQEALATSSNPPPLSTLSGGQRKTSWYEDDERATLDRRHMPRVEKDADDPTTPPASSRTGNTRHESTTLATLSRLFAAQSAVSRSPSYNDRPTSGPLSTYSRNIPGSETAPLPDHLYTRGLLQGRHSDITVNAFGHQYKLHRLILDRAPFFRSALSEPWLESNAKETAVHPEDLDSNIRQSSFELALKRLYGCSDLREEDGDAVGLFATGCWLEMQDLIDSSIESILRQMTPETLAPLIKLVTGNYYGRAGDKILSSAKAMLCRDGWRMALRCWDGIPGDIVREIVGGDGFFIDGEWERWVLAKRILDRRLKKRALDAGLIEPNHTGGGSRRRRVLKAPSTANLLAVRFDTVYRKTNTSAYSRGGGNTNMSDIQQRWIALYTHPDVEPLLVLLDEGIHYVHLDFEQLQLLRGARDVLGLPVLPEKVVSSALWQQMELRQRIVNAREGEMELDLSVKCVEDDIAARATATTVGSHGDTTMSLMSSPPQPTSTKGKHRVVDSDPPPPPLPETSAEDEDLDSGSWDGNGKPRKFWIPSSDCNIVMGGNADPVIATSNHTTLQRHASRLSATIQPEDVQWASDFAAATAHQQPRPTALPTISAAARVEGADGSASGGLGEVRYTHFPPFRFAAEFPHPRLLKEKKRVYSRTVFYAGSLWNIYIQKVASPRSKQLGVYLHRAKERETEEILAAAGTNANAHANGMVSGVGGTVDERIVMLEREMRLRSERQERRLLRRRRRHNTAAVAVAAADAGEVGGSETAADAAGESEESAVGDLDAAASSSSATAGGAESTGAKGPPTTTTRRVKPIPNTRKSRQSGLTVGLGSSPLSNFTSDDVLTPESDDSEEDSEDSDLDSAEDDDGEAETAEERSARLTASISAAAAGGGGSRQRPAGPPANRTPTLPPYVDARPTIKTYFKIYSPSRGGRMLSVYESAPDRFNFSQSWGWKSSTLMLDEGLLGDDVDDVVGGAKDEGGLDVGAGAGSGGEKIGVGGAGGAGREAVKGRGDGKLRFMVVIGNI